MKEDEGAIGTGDFSTSQPTMDYRIARAYIRDLLKTKPEFNDDDAPDTFPALLRWLERDAAFQSAKRNSLALQRVRRHDRDAIQRLLAGPQPLTDEELARL